MEYTFEVPGRPKSKDRPRMTRRGRAYTPEKTTLAEGHIADLYKGPFFEGPVVVEVDYFYDKQIITVKDWAMVYEDDGFAPPKWQADIDNLLKLTLDALQTRQVAFRDDKQVLGLYGAKW